ncbi:Rv3235 family protein [Nocardia sp. alder85J]|uniref:Rv3235 family protein n=1 Tax=Nocardia sp. alder85J TaxID=2862949 RepID=UPI001CD7F173|nr:Rv3235 family protein [Nocardia sp. alder85J]MCX4092156.1 Rv3235 family protein [Nocardia sp. alder85J]
MSDREPSRVLAPAPVFEPPLADVPGVSGTAANSVRQCATRPERWCRTRPERQRPSAPQCAGPAPDSAADTAVRRFAERAVRVVLEAVDGRRPVAQLAPLADPAVIAAVTTVVRTAAAERRLGPAVALAVNVAVVRPHVAEVFGSYERGGRRFALAARVIHSRRGWRLAVLRLR